MKNPLHTLLLGLFLGLFMISSCGSDGDGSKEKDNEETTCKEEDKLDGECLVSSSSSPSGDSAQFIYENNESGDDSFFIISKDTKGLTKAAKAFNVTITINKEAPLTGYSFKSLKKDEAALVGDFSNTGKLFTSLKKLANGNTAKETTVVIAAGTTKATLKADKLQTLASEWDDNEFHHDRDDNKDVRGEGKFSAKGSSIEELAKEFKNLIDKLKGS